MPVILSPKLLAAAALVAAAVFILPASAATLAFGPAIVLLENVNPSNKAEQDVFGSSEAVFTIYNKDEGGGWYHLNVVSPPASDKKQWEIGYETLPDASWCRLDKPEVEVQGKSNAKIKLFVKIPDKPEYYNRKFMAYVTCAPGKASVPGVGLQVASRVQLETLSKPDLDGDKAGSVAIAPAIMQSGAIPGAELDLSFKIRNNTAGERSYKVLRMDEVESDTKKHERYYGKGCTAVISPSWLKPKELNFKLKPGESKELVIDQTVPKDAVPKKKYEELVFIQDDAGNVNFTRVRTDITEKQQ